MLHANSTWCTSSSAIESKGQAVSSLSIAHTIPPATEKNALKDKVEQAILKPETDSLWQPQLPVFKDNYEILLLIPLNADKALSGNISRSKYLHFYAGMLLGLQHLNANKNMIKLRVVDTYSEIYKQKLIKKQVLYPAPDLVLGPLDREEVKSTAEEALEQKVSMISPWHTSTRIASDNPYYIQLKPNLKAHYRKIVSHATQQFNKGEIAVVTKKGKEGKSWYSYFQEQAEIQTGDRNYFFHYELHEDSLKYGTAFHNLFAKNTVSAVILPNYSFGDEEDVYHIMRKLAAEKGMTQMSLYGMPLLFDSEKIDFDLHYALNTRVVMSDFVDHTDIRVQDFKRRFLDEYGEIPMDDAVKGYDLMIFAGKSLIEHGLFFQFQPALETDDFLQANINLLKIKSEDSLQNMVKSFYENDHLDIIEFFQARFTKIY